MQHSYYQNWVSNFLDEDDELVLGKLSRYHEFALEDLQKNAWLKQIGILKTALSQYKQGKLYFEFVIPRMGKRVDNILIIKDLILVLEFKVGSSIYSNQAKSQTIDYCLDLMNFHEGSHNKKVIPILIATQAAPVQQDWNKINDLGSCVCCHQENLSEILKEVVSRFASHEFIDIQLWENSIYKPTPTIIEAAQALYKGHQVEEISRSDAGAINLEITSQKINQIIENAKVNHRKVICFLTGVPGAGKTLAGLNIANQRLKADETEHAVFLSGNGPLVDVLREALTRDTVADAKINQQSVTRSQAERRAKTFIQNIHHFRDGNLKINRAPIEKVVVFDEAQRAWQKDQVSNFMKQKKGIDHFDMSEPEYLIGVMNRHQDWCVIVCLIGGGQEINTGEAGVSEWINALRHKFTDWHVFYSQQILDEKVYLDSIEQKQWLLNYGQQETDLHLSVSIRSFRSEKVSQLIHCILEGEAKQAASIYQSMEKLYPIYITRDLKQAKKWVKSQSKGSERFGLIASSGARRLKADGIDVKNKITPSDWFLNTNNDVRSCYYLEDIATEFDIQGLEIDYACIAWDINLYYEQDWQYQAFKGTSWQNIKSEFKQKYLLNAYRVLLTRARQGMVIYIPQVDDSDWTRPSQKYESTYLFLKQCGLRVL